MFTEIHYPEYLPHQKLDEYLAKGWFRMGQMIFTCRFLCFDGKLYSAVRTRLALKNYTFRKSLRKIFNRNNDRFRVIVRRAVYDREKHDLYLLHRQRFEGKSSSNLRKSLFGDADYNIYNTWETCVYDGDKLVAASFFDLGDNSIASIMGLFHPDYSKHSLGIFTMLLEINFGLKTGADFYYPGYVVPGYFKFDYKLRIGHTDYFDPDQRVWKPYSEIQIPELAHSILKSKLEELQDYLNNFNIKTELLLYPLYERVVFGYEFKDFVNYPLFLSCYHQKNHDRLLIIEYDLFRELYRVIRTGKIENSHNGFLNVMRKGHDPDSSYFHFLYKDKILFESPHHSEIATTIHKNGRQFRMVWW